MAQRGDIPLGRVDRAEEFADLAATLSDRPYVTGSAISLDGGPARSFGPDCPRARRQELERISDQLGWPSADPRGGRRHAAPQPSLSTRAISRSASRWAIACRLSKDRRPRAGAISTFTQPS
jgi:hypothetical protein